MVILDNEAFQALKDPAHRMHRQVVSHAQGVANRKRRAAVIQVVVPTAVRVEAGWDRYFARVVVSESPADCRCSARLGAKPARQPQSADRPGARLPMRIWVQ